MAKKICIFGSYRDMGEKQKQVTLELGRLLAQNGFTVVSGGFGGTMEDISAGAKSCGGKTIGVTYYKWERRLYDKPNKFVDKEIVARRLFDRVEIMVRESDAFIVLPGGTGTLLELSAVLEYLNKGFMGWKPVILLGSFWKPVLDCLRKERVCSERIKKLGKVSYCNELVVIARTPRECIRHLGKLRAR